MERIKFLIFRRFVFFHVASMLRLEKKHNMCWCVLQSGLFFGLFAFALSSFVKHAEWRKQEIRILVL